MSGLRPLFILPPSGFSRFVQIRQIARNAIKCSSGALLTFERVMFYLSLKNGGRPNASVLCEMSCQKRDEGCQKHNHEEREAGDSGRVPRMWDQDVQDRQGLGLIVKLSGFCTKLDIPHTRISSLLLLVTRNGRLFHVNVYRLSTCMFKLTSMAILQCLWQCSSRC